jgi:integration host factor subunit alpha
MTKADIIVKVHDAIGFTMKESIDLVEQMLEILKSTLESGETIKITGFGNFVVRKKADRRGRNPQTGEEIVIGSRKVVTFKPGMVLKERVNR